MSWKMYYEANVVSCAAADMVVILLSKFSLVTALWTSGWKYWHGEHRKVGIYVSQNCMEISVLKKQDDFNPAFSTKE